MTRRVARRLQQVGQHAAPAGTLTAAFSKQAAATGSRSYSSSREREPADHVASSRASSWLAVIEQQLRHSFSSFHSDSSKSYMAGGVPAVYRRRK